MRVAACNGHLPFDVAFAADDIFILAWNVAQGENQGEEFDWRSLSWMKRS